MERARKQQTQRFQASDISCNGRILGGQVDKFCELHGSARRAIVEVEKKLPELTTRGHDTLLKVSRTIADLNNSPLIYKKHIAEAADLCGHEEARDLLSDSEETRVCPGCGKEIGVADSFCKYCGESL